MCDTGCMEVSNSCSSLVEQWQQSAFEIARHLEGGSMSPNIHIKIMRCVPAAEEAVCSARYEADWQTAVEGAVQKIIDEYPPLEDTRDSTVVMFSVVQAF